MILNSFTTSGMCFSFNRNIVKIVLAWKTPMRNPNPKFESRRGKHGELTSMIPSCRRYLKVLKKEKNLEEKQKDRKESYLDIEQYQYENVQEQYLVKKQRL